ncbi:Arginine/ornithine antiporter ArcD [hydrothermal vent metagenome]|uniref:Arginine/ornithine antiporter ArcD n=1 Tax=hydrothermal vent metagenome TaxID=652676 RepID=A0A3B0V8L2_9ZZZZ
MGAADIVPGVSGGTIALLTGIYPRLINAITSVNINTLKLLSNGKFKQFWKAVDGNFILPLLIGIIAAFALLSHPIKYVMTNHPIATWSFFFGLIIASAILIIQHIPNKKTSNYFALIPGLALGFWIGSLTSIPFPSNEIAVFIAGMIAICAMILPGISGSFILLLLGMYEVLITAVATRHWTTLFIFIGGAILGLLIFSRVIKLVLDKFYNITLFFLSGLMLGSLTKLWPWKLEQHDIVQGQNHITNITNVLPANYPNAQTAIAIAMMVLAIILVFSVDYFGSKLNSPIKNPQ